MLFLHLLPSPSPCALLLTPNPQEEYGARARRGPDREVGRPVPSSSPAGPVGVWRLGGSGGPPGDRLGHRGGGWGAHCSLRGSPDLPASWGPVRPAERLPPQEAAPLALGPKLGALGAGTRGPCHCPDPGCPGAFWHLITATFSSSPSPSSLSLSPRPHLSVSLSFPFLSFFDCFFLSFLSLSLLSFKISPSL